MRARLDIDYARALRSRLRAVTIAMNCVPRDNLARLTRGSQPVINTGHYQPFKHPHVALSTNRSRDTVWGIYECVLKSKGNVNFNENLSSIGRQSCEIIMKKKTPLSHHRARVVCI